MAILTTAEVVTTKPGATNTVLRIALILVTIIAIVFGLTQSFRLTTISALTIHEANLTRVLVCFAAGMAFAASGVMDFKQAKLITHVKAYSILMLALFGLLIGHFLTYPIYLNVIFALVAASLAFVITNRILRESRWQNILMSALLVLVLLVSMLNFFLASATPDRLGIFALWLLGDLNRLTGNGLAILALSFILTTWLILSRQKSLPSLLLLGLGIGVVGPIFFISVLVPHYAHKVSNTFGQAVFCAALIGGATLMLADATPKFLFGGYNPPLSISIAIITIPLLMLLNRSRLQESFPSRLRSRMELLMVAVLAMIAVFVITHVGGYALPLI